MANTLAYYDATIITVVISFVAQAPGPYTIKHFTAVPFRNKRVRLSLLVTSTPLL
jgi:hypothetical protein